MPKATKKKDPPKQGSCFVKEKRRQLDFKELHFFLNKRILCLPLSRVSPATNMEKQV